jgi:hypothetical protein
MKLRLPNTLRKIADWDLRLQLVAIAAIFLGGLLLILFEECAVGRGDSQEMRVRQEEAGVR